jgi:phosphoglycolate phosphatase-like HAD superfamily hydrolase
MISTKDNFVVGFDLDGVIVDHTQNKIVIAARYGITLSGPQTHSQKMIALIPQKLYREIQEQLYDDTDEALSAPLMEGAYSGLAKLRELGIPYFLISRRKKPVHAIHLLERRELWGEYFTPENTFFVEKPKEKDVVARQLGVTHFVDDESHVLEVMTSVKTRILYDARSLFEGTDGYVHVKSWSELAAFFGVAHR